MEHRVKIVDLDGSDSARITQAAELLVDGFRELAPNAWPDLERALETVRESVGGDRICRAALATSGRLAGWIGGMPQYDGHVWELVYMEPGAPQ